MKAKRRKKRRNRTALAAGALALFLGGCTSDEVARRTHTEEFLPKLKERTDRALIGRNLTRELTREECIEIALKQNLDLQVASLETKLRSIERDIAFSAFLPRVRVSLSRSGYNHPVIKRFQFGGVAAEAPVRDRYTNDVSWNFVQPVFVPFTWFLYALHVHARAAAEYIEKRVRQEIAAQVSALYFHVLALEKKEKALSSALKEAEEIFRRARALAREGVITETDLAEARLLFESRQSALRTVKRSLASAKGSLLKAMGCDPRSDLALAESPPPTIPSEDPVELTYNALLNRPELYAADRKILADRTAAFMALAQFLPGVEAFASHLYTSDSLTKYRNTWYYGIGAVIDIFEGLRRVNEYRRGRTAEDQSRAQREELYLAIILQVLNAHREYERAGEALDVAQHALDVNTKRLSETRALFREGIADTAQLLASEKAYEEASAAYIAARYQRDLALVILADVSGFSEVGGASAEKENTKETAWTLGKKRES